MRSTSKILRDGCTMPGGKQPEPAMQDRTTMNEERSDALRVLLRHFVSLAPFSLDLIVGSPVICCPLIDCLPSSNLLESCCKPLDVLLPKLPPLHSGKPLLLGQPHCCKLRYLLLALAMCAFKARFTALGIVSFVDLAGLNPVEHISPESLELPGETLALGTGAHIEVSRWNMAPGLISNHFSSRLILLVEK